MCTKKTAMKENNWDQLYNICVKGWKVGLPETKCGGGSTIENNRTTIAFMNKLIRKYDIQSIADLGCGDFNWMKQVELNNVYYVGYDWVWHTDTLQYEFDEYRHIEFRIGNIATIDIIPADLVVCKDVLIHMDNDQALATLDNIKKSKARYILVTSYDVKDNERVLSNYAPMNMEKPPFNLTNKLESIETAPGKYLNLYEY